MITLASKKCFFCILWLIPLGNPLLSQAKHLYSLHSWAGTCFVTRFVVCSAGWGVWMSATLLRCGPGTWSRLQPEAWADGGSMLGIFVLPVQKFLGLKLISPTVAGHLGGPAAMAWMAPLHYPLTPVDAD